MGKKWKKIWLYDVRHRQEEAPVAEPVVEEIPVVEEKAPTPKVAKPAPAKKVKAAPKKNK